MRVAGRKETWTWGLAQHLRPWGIRPSAQRAARPLCSRIPAEMPATECRQPSRLSWAPGPLPDLDTTIVMRPRGSPWKLRNKGKSEPKTFCKAFSCKGPLPAYNLLKNPDKAN